MAKNLEELKPAAQRRSTRATSKKEPEAMAEPAPPVKLTVSPAPRSAKPISLAKRTASGKEAAKLAREENESKTYSVAAALTAGFSGVPNFSEFEEILSRLVDRIAKILQAEKCVFLLHNPVKGALIAVSPAFGISSEELAKFHTKSRGHGLTASVFRSGEAVLLTRDQLRDDPRAIADHLNDRLHAHNSVSVPLFIETRDNENKVVSRDVIGVAHVFNKGTNGEFGDEDRNLLESMSKNAASIFSSAQAFRDVVHEKQELIHTLESLYVGLMMVALDGRIIQINPAARNVLGIDPEMHVVGLRYEMVSANAQFHDLLDRSLAGLDPVEVTGEIVTHTGIDERVYQAHCAPVKDQDEVGSVVGVLILLNDITEIRGVDRMKTAFISTVSHELRTPLTSIKGFIATLLADTDGFYDLDTQREFYRIIDTECDRLTRLIDDLLNVSRIEQGRAMELIIEKIHIPTIVTKVLTSQRAYTISDRHRLEMQFGDDFPLIEADADKIDQILTNLVNNAIKYSPQGGTIMVTGGEDRAHGTVYFSICDNGMGIPREHLKKIFDRFHRVDNRDNREIGGTGIGLFLVKTLTESHHGTIKVESEPGRGSIFTVTLPLQQPEHE